MKYRIGLLLCLLSCVTGLVLTPAVSLAAPPTVIPSATGVGPSSEQQLFLEMKAAAKPYQATMRENSKELEQLKETLAIEVAASRSRIQGLQEISVTKTESDLLADQLTSLRALITEIQTNVGILGQEMTILRGFTEDLDLDGMIQSYEDAIEVQEQRIGLVETALTLVRSIAAP